jgi:REP element-mobilizing transposase RayT
MPDHGHFLFVGLEERADQLPAMAWFRREWNGLLNPHKQQDQAYDSVLKEDDRKADGFPDLVAYILRNPIRKDLTENWSEWPYSGCVFPGYPKLDPRKDFFWDNFWTAYYRQNGVKD